MDWLDLKNKKVLYNLHVSSQWIDFIMEEPTRKTTVNCMFRLAFMVGFSVVYSCYMIIVSSSFCTNPQFESQRSIQLLSLT